MILFKWFVILVFIQSLLFSAGLIYLIVKDYLEKKEIKEWRY